MFKKGDKVVLKGWKHSHNMWGTTKSINEELASPKKKTLTVIEDTEGSDGRTRVAGLDAPYSIHALDLELFVEQPSFKELAKEHWKSEEQKYVSSGISLALQGRTLRVGRTFTLTGKERVQELCLCLLALAEDMK